MRAAGPAQHQDRRLADRAQAERCRGIALHAQALIEETAGVGDARLTQLVSATIQ